MRGAGRPVLHGGPDVLYEGRITLLLRRRDEMLHAGRLSGQMRRHHLLLRCPVLRE